MKKFLKSHNAKDKLKVFIVSLLAITFLAVPVLAEKMSPEEKLVKAERLSTQASEKESAARVAREAGNLGLALVLFDEARAIASDALTLIEEVASYASEADDAVLAQAALNIIYYNLQPVINQIRDACQNIVQTSTDPGIVALAEDILAKIEQIQNLINKIMAILIASGAVLPAEPYEPPPAGLEIPVDEEPPIQDITPASGT